MTQEGKNAVVGLTGAIGIAHALFALPVAVISGLLTGIFALGLGFGWLYASYWLHCQGLDDDDPDEDEIPQDEERESTKVEGGRPVVVDFPSNGVAVKRRAS